MDLVGLDAVAEELYGLPLDDFVPTRNAREKQAKSTGDGELARQIHRLAKPNAVAWLVNQLVRQHDDDIRALLALGSALREATASLSGDRLRQLSHQQHEAVRRLVRQAEQLANAGGRQVSTDAARGLEETLYATLADPDAADAVSAGRLTAGLRSTGFASLESTSGQRPRSVAKVPSTSKARPRPHQRDGVERRRERAESKVTGAKSAVDVATRVRGEALVALKQVEQCEVDARGRAEQLRRDLQEAAEDEARAKADRRQAQSAFNRADREVQGAQRRLVDATTEQNRLAD